MPILCSRASVSLRLRSKSESSGVISLFCWLSDCSGYIKKRQLTHFELKNKLKDACACTFWSKIPTPTFCTHIDVCMHAWTHTTSAFYVSRPDKKQSNTQTIHTRVRYSMSAGCANYSLFSLPLSSSSPPPFSFFPPWFGRGAASCAPALLLGHFCPTWCPTGLQGRGSSRIELHVALSQYALVSLLHDTV